MIAQMTWVTAPTLGLALALFTVIAPAAPFGPLFASPPVPYGMLWLAFGWAASGASGPLRPAFLFIAGLAQDQISGGPLGVMAAFYVAAYVFSGVSAQLTRSISWISAWAGFAGAAIAAGLVAAGLAVWALPLGFAVQPFAVTVALTILSYPLVRGLYVERAAAAPAGGQP